MSTLSVEEYHRIEVEALGDFLGTYRKNLNYFHEYQLCVGDMLSRKDYCNAKNPHSFTSFIREFKVARNVSRNKYHDLLNRFLDQSTTPDPTLINQISTDLNSLTRGQKAVSLISKIMMLAFPETITPLDSLAKKALRRRANDYVKFFEEFKNFRDANSSRFELILQKYEREIQLLESTSQYKSKEMSTIRLNRFTDKILWRLGSENLTIKEIYIT